LRLIGEEPGCHEGTNPTAVDARDGSSEVKTARRRRRLAYAFGLTQNDELERPNSAADIKPADEVDPTVAGALGDPTRSVLTAISEERANDLRREPFESVFANSLVDAGPLVMCDHRSQCAFRRRFIGVGLVERAELVTQVDPRGRWLLAPGPRLADGVRQLGHLLHPDAVPDPRLPLIDLREAPIGV
jgi:hypothetical protein